MKKIKKVTGIALISATAFGMVACSGRFANEGSKNIEIASRDYQDFYLHTADIYKDYVDLGNYKDLEVADVDRSNEEISDEEVETVISALAAEYRTEEDLTEGGTTQKGDEIILNYSGTIDGKAFDGGTAQEQAYTVGSLQFIEDLDKGLVDKKANEEYKIPVKFPDNYQSEELKGKEAEFTVTITKIIRPTNATIDDEWIKSHTSELEEHEYGKNISSLDALKEAIKTQLSTTAKNQNDQVLYGELVEKIVENANIESYPEEEVNYLVGVMSDNVKNQFDQYGSAMGIESYEDFIKKYYNYDTTEEFEKYVKSEAETYLRTKMVTTLIAADNNINVSAADIEEEGNSIAAQSGAKYEDYVENYGAIINAEIGYQVLYNKVSEFMADKIKTTAATEGASTNSDGIEIKTDDGVEITTETAQDAENKAEGAVETQEETTAAQ